MSRALRDGCDRAHRWQSTMGELSERTPFGGVAPSQTAPPGLDRELR